jgi:hypothetical protein
LNKLITVKENLSLVVEKHDNIVRFKVGNKEYLRESFIANIEALIKTLSFHSGILTDNKVVGINSASKELEHLFAEIISKNISNVQNRGGSPEIFKNELQGLLISEDGIIDELEKCDFSYVDFKKYYIPTLRNLHCFNDWLVDITILSSQIRNGKNNSGDFFQDRVHDAYYSKNYDGSSPAKYIPDVVFTGQDMYRRIRKMLLNKREERKKVEKYQRFLAEYIFNVNEVTLIPGEEGNEKSDEVLLVQIGDKEHKIYDYGDGVQALIILTFPLFDCDDGLFFIEEPEVHLHPGMQRRLIEIFKAVNGKYGKNHQYFITTHSNHLLDLTLDYEGISVYNFRQDVGDKKVIKQVSQGDSSTLKLLGVQNSSIFLSNKTIWVEGISDRWYIREYLRMYSEKKKSEDNNFKEINEDIDYSFVEYGGNNITHWSFLDEEEMPINIERLCGEAFLVVDSDGYNVKPSENQETTKKKMRIKKLREAMGNDFYELPCREIENVLPISLIKKIIESYPKNKNVNVVIKEGLKRRYSHRDVYLGRFIENKIVAENQGLRKRLFSSSSGTVSDKRDFCKKASQIMQKDKMTIDLFDNNGENIAYELAKNIYNFIVE